MADDTSLEPHCGREITAEMIDAAEDVLLTRWIDLREPHEVRLFREVVVELLEAALRFHR